MIVAIAQNAALLGVAAIGVYWVFQRPKLAPSPLGCVELGLIYGLTTFLVTIMPITLENGATIDARAGSVIIAGMLGGPIAATIAAIFGGFARWYIGGSFAFPGVAVFALYAGIGTLVWRQHLQAFLGADVSWARIGIGAGLSIAAASSMYFLISPEAAAVQWMTTDFPWIAVANTFSILLSALLAKFAMAAAVQKLNLAQAVQTLEIAQHAGGIGIWSYDLKTKKVTWDDTNKKLHGITLDSASGRFEDWEKVVHPDDLELAKTQFEKSIETGQPYEIVYRVILPNGAIRTLKGHAVLTTGHNGMDDRVVGTNIDLTPILEKEKELNETKSIAVHSQKLDIVGKLSGGVAHDFNNLLAIVQGNLEFLLQDESERKLPEAERLDILTSAISATRRGGELTRSMLAFARKSRLDPQRVQLNDIVRETENWIARAIPSSIQIDTSLQHAIWPLKLDLASVQSALVNVIVNARDAMPSGGKLTIETSNLRIDEEYAELLEESVLHGRYVMLAVTDTGTGIDPEILPNVFEPFVSSKPMSLGSGLGLSMVEGFARQSGGFVKIYSEIGVGTCVKMFFPITMDEADLSADAARNKKTKKEPSSEGRILVAEDQIEVLAVIVRSLKSAGYDVDAAPNGDQAFEMFKGDDAYDLLLTDVVMPGNLLGPDLAKACRELRPELPVVFMSGYASEATVHGNGLRPDDIRLMKPVPQSELLHTIKTSLKRAAQT
ncbi:MAG: PAS domain-containing protein [Roseobacter sp.]